ncbi:cuticle protein AM/CP1114 [Cherax quadricarinatus]|uniref:cuticle protein AM/CP1114 n=1 Tax=Cherax quadricarinatus TaxID=27406 RepID=UPI0023789490|nr:cuticle protein AM/CP1114-like [Cherax quadricarinatus]
MQLVVLAVLASVAIAAPQYEAPAPSPSRYGDDDSKEHVPILKDERVHEDDGTYSVSVETGDGIQLSESGAPTGPEGAIESSGQYSYTAPDGTKVSLSYVADENGFQPQSDLLPVAPEFPHEIPEFVQEQIAFAAKEDAEREREEARAPSRSYGAPQ